MKSRYRAMSSVFAVMLALGAVASASASAALPEFFPTHSVTFKGTGGQSYFEVSGLQPTPNCESHATRGSITGAKSGTIEVELKGCRAGLQACSTTGQASGVVLFSGATEPVYLSKEPKNVGLLVKVTEFTAHCGLATATVQGSFLGSITPINKKVKSTESFALVAKEKSGVNEFTTYENAAGEHKSATLSQSIDSGPFVQAGYQSTEQLTPSVESELKA